MLGWSRVVAYPQARPEFVGFSVHNLLLLKVSPLDIKNGSHIRLEGLQGHKNTW